MPQFTLEKVTAKQYFYNALLFWAEDSTIMQVGLAQVMQPKAEEHIPIDDIVKASVYRIFFMYSILIYEEKTN